MNKEKRLTMADIVKKEAEETKRITLKVLIKDGQHNGITITDPTDRFSDMEMLEIILSLLHGVASNVAEEHKCEGDDCGAVGLAHACENAFWSIAATHLKNPNGAN